MDDRPGSHREFRHNDRQRSRSPRRQESHRTRRRSKSPHHRHRRAADVAPVLESLPYNSRHLTKRDYVAFRPMFALYLDIQKGKMLEDMDDVEARGRWKSFIGKWNRGELSDGWYDPTTFQKASQSANVDQPTIEEHDRPAFAQNFSVDSTELKQGDDEDSDDSIGPALPGQEAMSRKRKAGPSIPNMEDLELKREMDTEDAMSRRDDLRWARKSDQKQQKAALDELVPRAEAGTRERQLEKKKEVNEKMKSFREKSPGAAEVPDSELMGGGDGIDTFKKQKEVLERKKNERELRKEEFLRARQAERDERMAEYQAKEEGTMAMLKALAKQNFG